MSTLKITNNGLENSILKDGQFVFGSVNGNDSSIISDAAGSYAGGYLQDTGYIKSSGEGSYAHGYVHNSQMCANGKGAHAEGCETVANADYSHAEGYHTFANGEGAHAEGYDISKIDTNINFKSFTGSQTLCIIKIAYEYQINKLQNIIDKGHNIIEYNNVYTKILKVYPDFSDATQYLVSLDNPIEYSSNGSIQFIIDGAQAVGSHTEGLYTVALGTASHAEGYDTQAGEILYTFEKLPFDDLTISNNTIIVTSQPDLAQYDRIKVSNNEYLYVVSIRTSEEQFTIELSDNITDTQSRWLSENGIWKSIIQNNGQYSHVEGHLTKALADGAHAEGYAEYGGDYYDDSKIVANKKGSHAEGYTNNFGTINANGTGAHAEGCADNFGAINANGSGSHAEGYTYDDGTINANGSGAHVGGCAEDQSSILSYGAGSHAEGYAEYGGTINASSNGACIIGAVAKHKSIITIGSESITEGGIAGGIADNNSSILLDGYGAIAYGFSAENSIIKATGSGASAIGCAYDGGNLIANGNGAIALGFNTIANQTGMTAVGCNNSTFDEITQLEKQSRFVVGTGWGNNRTNEFEVNTTGIYVKHNISYNTSNNFDNADTIWFSYADECKYKHYRTSKNTNIFIANNFYAEDGVREFIFRIDNAGTDTINVGLYEDIGNTVEYQQPLIPEQSNSSYKEKISIESGRSAFITITMWNSDITYRYTKTPDIDTNIIKTITIYFNTQLLPIEYNLLFPRGVYQSTYQNVMTGINSTGSTYCIYNFKYINIQNFNWLRSLSFNYDTIDHIAFNLPIREIGIGAFSNCVNLKYIAGDGCRTIKKIGKRAFKGTSYGQPTTGVSEDLLNLSRLYNLKYISDQAFQNTKFEKLHITANVIYIGKQAFAGCTSLTSITCKAIIPPTIASNTFQNVSKTISVYVPAGSVESYKSANYWKQFTNIQAISE